MQIELTAKDVATICAVLESVIDGNVDFLLPGTVLERWNIEKSASSTRSIRMPSGVRTTRTCRVSWRRRSCFLAS